MSAGKAFEKREYSLQTRFCSRNWKWFRKEEDSKTREVKLAYEDWISNRQTSFAVAIVRDQLKRWLASIECYTIQAFTVKVKPLKRTNKQ